MFSDIAHYLPFLESQAKGNVLEIGVRKGESTKALLSGIKKNGGHLYSIDVDDCGHLFQDGNWSFLKVSSHNHEEVKSRIPKAIDVLFIDGDHSREGYRDDLRTYSSLVQDGGLIISHDIDTSHGYTIENGHFDGPSQFIKDEYFQFIEETGYSHYELPGFAGMGIIMKKATDRIIVTPASRLNPFIALNPKCKILIAFISAHHESRVPHVAAQRARIAGSPIDYKFVYGDRSSQSNPLPERTPEKDELFFDVDDTKPYMVLKDKALFQWALSRGYDFVFRACDDSIVHPERILQNLETLQLHDYAGTMCGYGGIAGYSEPYVLRYLDYMHGGVGIWLSARAMRMLIADDWKGPYSSPLSTNIEILPGTWFKGFWNIYWDDLWIGEVLKGNLNYNDPRRNDLYNNYLVHVWDNPELFASNLPFDADKVIATHSYEQMGMSDLKPKSFSTRVDRQIVLNVQWDKTKSDFHAVAPEGEEANK